MKADKKPEQRITCGNFTISRYECIRRIPSSLMAYGRVGTGHIFRIEQTRLDDGQETKQLLWCYPEEIGNLRAALDILPPLSKCKEAKEF